jgi:acyl-CoA synthetase (AMP-forming)/AMP-acid ligase II
MGGPTYAAARQALDERWRREGWFRGATVAASLAAGARTHADAPLVFGSRTRPATITVAEAHRQGRILASALRQRGMRPGDVLVMQLPNWAEWAVGWCAAMHAGLVVAPVVHIYGPAELGYVVRSSGARALITPDQWRATDYLDRVGAMGDCPTLDLVVTVGQRTVAGGVLWDDLVAEGTERTEAVGRRPDDACLLLYTSGTTAAPKGVIHSNQTFLAEIATMARELRRKPGVVFLNGGPAGHITGALTISRPFLDGSAAVSMDAWSAEDAVDLALRHGVTHSVGAPVFLDTMLDVADARHVRLPLHEFMLGAASVTPASVGRADEAGIPGYRCYGSTEHPTVSTGHPWDPADVRMQTDGAVVAGSQVRIVDEHDRPVPDGSEGDVLCIGPDQFVGYLDPDLDRAAFTDDGWFRTGDIGRLSGGTLTITDRRKDVIIRGGENLSSNEIEDALARHPAVADVAVVAAPHDRLGECACAFVVLRPGAALDIPTVGAWFAELGLARPKTPERLEMVADLPRTPSGKVRKVELRARLRAKPEAAVGGTR